VTDFARPGDVGDALPTEIWVGDVVAGGSSSGTVVDDFVAEPSRLSARDTAVDEVDGGVVDDEVGAVVDGEVGGLVGDAVAATPSRFDDDVIDDVDDVAAAPSRFDDDVITGDDKLVVATPSRGDDEVVVDTVVVGVAGGTAVGEPVAVVAATSDGGVGVPGAAGSRSAVTTDARQVWPAARNTAW